MIMISIHASKNVASKFFKKTFFGKLAAETFLMCSLDKFSQIGQLNFFVFQGLIEILCSPSLFKDLPQK